LLIFIKMNVINPNYGGGSGRGDRIDERMGRMFDKLEGYLIKIEKKFLNEELSEIEKEARMGIAVIGALITETKILAEEGSSIDRIKNPLIEARKFKNNLYKILIRDQAFSPESVDELKNKHLAIKARRIYEIGVSNIKKYIEKY